VSCASACESRRCIRTRYTPIATTSRTPTPAPTPMPAFSPVLRPPPDEGCGVREEFKDVVEAEVGSEAAFDGRIGDVLCDVVEDEAVVVVMDVVSGAKYVLEI